MSIKRKFKRGDQVVLKSGGPKMTVDGYAWHGNYESYDTIICIWFHDNERKISEFSQESVNLSVD